MASDNAEARASIAEIAAAEWGKVVAVVANEVRNLTLAEEVTQDAFAAAIEKWPVSGVPQRPGAWLLTVARRKAIDRMRRESTGRSKLDMIARLEARLSPAATAIDSSLVRDEQLQLIFACSHPSLAVETQLTLILRCVLGVPTPDIAKAFLVSESAMAQRLVRGKRKVRDSSIPLVMPPDADLYSRLAVVHHSIYLLFSNGYLPASGGQLLNVDLSSEAIRLARLLVELLPSDAESKGLLALCLFLEARAPARTDADGRLVLLADQDRQLWSSECIAEAQELLGEAVKRERPGAYQIQAAINALHCEAASADDTDWHQIELLYRSLRSHTDGAVVRLNHAVAVSMAQGPAEALSLLEDLKVELDEYHYFHAAKAEMLLRLGQPTQALPCFQRSLALVTNDAERAFLDRRIIEIGRGA